MTATMERSSEAARVAAAIRAEMEAQSLNGVDLAERIGLLTGTRPSEMAITRRVKGQIHMTRVKRVAEWAPAENLKEIAQALVMTKDGHVDGAEAERLAQKLADAALDNGDSSTTSV